MSDIEVAEEISDQMRSGVNRMSRNRAGYVRCRISPQFERARAARPQKETTKSLPAPLLDPPEEAAQPLPEIKSYDELIVCLRARADQLKISRAVIDEIAGLPDRYASKILSPGGAKRIGMRSLGNLLCALGLKLIAVDDPETLERCQGRRAPRNESQVRRRKRAAATDTGAATA
jgi:hypothetical protein